MVVAEPETSIDPGAGADEAPGAPTPLLDRAPQAARWTFAALLAAAVPYWALRCRGQWFFQDEWAFLVWRDGGSIEDLLRPHNEHWTTLPVIIYRVVFNLFGLRSYRPYQAVNIAFHLATAVLVRAVAVRSGASPWLATVAAGLFLFYGSGGENVIWAFQITFIGGLTFGLAHLLLADHADPSLLRRAAAFASGLAALMFSGVGLVVVAAAGLAVAARRGIRAALLQQVPLAAVYLVWWTTHGIEPDRDRRSRPDQVLRMVGNSLEHALESLGQSRAVGLGISVLAILGVLLAAWAHRRSFAALRVTLAIPLALVVGATAFLALTAFSGHAGLGLEDPDLVRDPPSRYSYVVIALLAPVLAYGASVVVRRWRVALVPVLVLLVVGVPGNLSTSWRREHPLAPPALVLALAHAEELASAPADQRPLADTPGPAMITVGWLRTVRDDGRLPEPTPVRPSIEAEAHARLALRIGPDRPEDAVCRPAPAGGEVVRVTADDGIVFFGAFSVRVVGSDGSRSQPQSIGSFERRTLTTAGPPLTLDLRPKRAGFPSLCREPAATRRGG